MLALRVLKGARAVPVFAGAARNGFEDEYELLVDSLQQITIERHEMVDKGHVWFEELGRRKLRIVWASVHP